MSKFETAWKEGYSYFARVNENGKSKKIEIPSSIEYYEPNVNGRFKYILDQNLRMTRKLGRYKDAQNGYGVRNPIDVYIRDHHWDKNGEYNTNPTIFYLDIETRADFSFPVPNLAEKEITLIQIYDTARKVMIILGTRDYHKEEGYDFDFPLKYIKCTDEVDLLTKYCEIFKALDPLIIYAWNGEGFDYPYIYNRLKNLGLDPNKMSNYGECKLEETVGRNNTTIYKLHAPGHFYIDLIQAYRKITISEKSSFALDFIANYELGEGKVDHSEFSTFDSFYTGDDYIISKTPYTDKVREEIRQLKIKEQNNTLTDEDKIRLKNLLQFQFVYYGAKDVYLLKRLDDKISITNILLSMSSTMGCLFDDTLGTLKPWGNYIANVCYQMDLVIPKKTENENPNIVGGFVKDPIRGKHHWVMSFDYNSMYPMNMVGFNISAETYVPLSKCPPELRPYIQKYFNSQDEGKVLDLPNEVWDKVVPLLQKYHLSLGINGALFDTSKEGIIPRLVWDIYTQRKADKKKMLAYEKQKEIIADILSKRKEN